MFGTGVASFGHVNGVHMQNVDSWDEYVGRLEHDELPLNRALPVGPRERLIREMILQLKTGRLEIPYFQRKFGVDVRDEFRKGFDQLEADGCLQRPDGRIELTRKGLLEVDRRLPAFFLPEHLSARYT